MPVKIVHTGDAHVDSDQHGGINPDTGVDRAWESHAAALASVVKRAVDEKADLFIHAGDAFKNGRPSQEGVLLVAETLRPLALAGIPTLLLGGNHERLLVPTRHRTATDTVGDLLAAHGPVKVVERQPDLIVMPNGVQVAALPWLSKTTILSMLGQENLEPSDGDRVVVQFALDALERMFERADPTAPLVMASHVTLDDVRIDSVVPGNRRGSEMDITHLFAEPILPRQAVQQFPASYVALSHIHAAQRMGTKCFYSGSPDRLTLTDADDVKSANLVTISDGNVLEMVEQFHTDARAMHVINLVDLSAEDRLAGLTPGALVGIELAPGEAAVPDVVRQAVRDAGATIVNTKVTPKERTRSTAPALPEKIEVSQALRAWLVEKHPDADHDLIVDTASKMTGEAA